MRKLQFLKTTDRRTTGKKFESVYFLLSRVAKRQRALEYSSVYSRELRRLWGLVDRFIPAATRLRSFQLRTKKNFKKYVSIECHNKSVNTALIITQQVVYIGIS